MQEGTLSEQNRRSAADRFRRQARSIALALAVGVLFFLAAKLGLGLPSSSGFVQVFWPAMGFGVGVLIGLGPSERWPVLAAITVANFLANLSNGYPPQIALATCLSEATECLLPAILIERWFGAGFSLARLRHVLGLLAAGTAGSVAGAVCWIVASRLFYGPTGPIPMTFLNWFMSDMVGFITLGPFVIGLFSVVRQPAPLREIIEGFVALLALALMLAIIIPLPSQFWETALPIAWLFPMLLWLTARSRPFFAAAAAALVSITVVSTTVIGIGHFGDPKLPIDDRILQAQSAILFVALCAFILAALFAERRESEAQIAREQDKLQTTLRNLREAQSSLIEAEKLAALGRLVAGVAHEVNSPVGVSLTIASTLEHKCAAFAAEAARGEIKRSSLSEFVRATREASSQLVANITRASELVQSFKQVAADRDHSDLRTFDIGGVTEQIVMSLRAGLRKQPVDLNVECQPDLTMNSYPGPYGQVLTNLLLNSVMHAFPDGQSGTIDIRVKAFGEHEVEVLFADDGCGMNVNVRREAFNPFFTTRRDLGCTGLGLHIVHNIVTSRLGGRLDLQSDPGNGTTIQMILPRIAPESENDKQTYR